MERRAFKSVSTAVPSSHLVCGRWFSGPNTETFALIPLYNFALGEEERLSFPIYAGLFFLSKCSQTETLLSCPFLLYWPQKCHLLSMKLLLISPWRWSHTVLVHRNPCLLLTPSVMKGWGLFFLQPLTALHLYQQGTTMPVPCACQGASSHALRQKWEVSSTFTSTEILLSPHG